MIKTTKAQRKALHRIWQRTIWDKPNPLTYREFRATVTPGMGWIGIEWAGMYLGIEEDGYTHS